MTHISKKAGKFLSMLIILLSFFIGLSNLNTVSAQNDSLEVYSLINSVVDNFDDYDLAINYSREASKIAKQSNCLNCIAESEYYLGILQYYNLKTDSAILHLENTLAYLNKTNNDVLLVNTLDYLSSINMEIFFFNESIIYCEQGMQLADSLGMFDKKANFYLTLGMVYQETGQYKKSSQALVNALSLFETEDDSTGIASALISLGLVFANDENFDAASKSTVRALNLCHIMGDLYGVSACLNNLGYFNSSENNFVKALDYFQQALEIDRKLGDTEGVAISLNNIGDSYKELEDTTLAISYYTKSLNVCGDNNYSIESLVFYNLGEVSLYRGDAPTALLYALRSIKIAKLHRLTGEILIGYDLLQKCYAALANFQQAYKYLLLHKQLYDSTYSIDKSKNIQEVISLYNDEKQKEEISSLKVESTIASKYRTHLIRTIFAISFFLIVLFIAIFFTRRSKIREKKQKLYYEKLLGRSEDFIFVVNKEGRTSYISPSYQRKIGRGVDNRIGRDSFEFIHPDDIENVKKEFAKLAFDAQPRNFEFRMQKDDGKWICVSAYGQNLFDDPMIQGIVVNFWDITQRKKNEMLIKKNETKFRQIFNAFPDIYFEADLSGVVTEISPSVEKIAGYTRDEIIGTNPKEHYRYIGNWEEIELFFDANTFVNDFDTKIITKSGNSINCSFSAEIILSDNNTPVGIKGVVRDISSRIAGHEKLRESEQKLKEANKSKELLFSIISHDLIGPIGTNKSIVDLIVGQIDEFSHEEIVSLITSLKPSLDSTFSLIENLLSWAQIQQDRISPSFEKISLNKMIREMVMVLLEQANRKSISLNIIGTKPITVYADKNQLDVVLRNLVSNAVKFSKINGQVIISIDIIDDMAEVKITDLGIGMSKNQIDEILGDKGSTNVRRGTDNEKGTGFGLIIVNEFIKNNKGKLHVHSNVEEGTTFTIELPLFQ